MAKKKNILERAVTFTFVKVPKAGVKAGNKVRSGWKKKK